MADEPDNDPFSPYEVEGDSSAERWFRSHVLRELRRLTQKIEGSERTFVRQFDEVKQSIKDEYVTKEVFNLVVGPMKRIGWLIFSVVITALLGGVLALLFQAGKGLKP